MRLLSDPSVSPHIPSQQRQGGLAFWWETPRLSLADGNVVALTVDLHAGFRELSSGRIFTLNGPARVTLASQVTAAATGPTLSVILAGVGGHQAVDISGLQISYAGLTPPPPEISARIHDEVQNQAGALAVILRSQLNSLREAVPPVALPNSLVGVRGGANLSVATVGVHTFGPATGDALAVGASLTGGGGVATAMTDALATHPTSNVAVTALDTAINRTVAGVLGEGLFFMNGDHTLRLARLKQLSITFRPGAVEASGRIVPPSSGDSSSELVLADFAGALFSVSLTPSITIPGQLTLTPGSCILQLRRRAAHRR